MMQELCADGCVNGCGGGTKVEGRRHNNWYDRWFEIINVVLTSINMNTDCVCDTRLFVDESVIASRLRRTSDMLTPQTNQHRLYPMVMYECNLRFSEAVAYGRFIRFCSVVCIVSV